MQLYWLFFIFYRCGLFLIGNNVMYIQIGFRFVVMVFFSLIVSGIATHYTFYSNDNYEYMFIFNHAYDASVERIEPLFLFLAQKFNSVELGFGFFWFVISFISLFIKFNLLARTGCNNFVLILLILLYCMSLVILHEITQIRVAIAISFGFLGVYTYVSRGGNFFSVVFILIAAMFHYSAMLFFVVYFIGDLNNSSSLRKIISYFFILFVPYAFGSLVSYLGALNPLLSYYYENSEEVVNAGLFSMTNILAAIFSICCLLAQLFFLLDRLTKTFIFFCYFGLTCLIGLSFSPVLSIRIYELFSFSGFIVVALFYSKYSFYGFDGVALSIQMRAVRVLLLLSIISISLHRFIAYVYVNPILNFTQ